MVLRDLGLRDLGLRDLGLRDLCLILIIMSFSMYACEDENQAIGEKVKDLALVDAFVVQDGMVKDQLIGDTTMPPLMMDLSVLDSSMMDLSVVDQLLRDQLIDDVSVESDLASIDMMINEWPMPARPDTIYAHTDRSLYSLNVKNDQVLLINDFSFENGGTDQITDIAFDRRNILWAISFTNLYICDAQSAVCRDQGALPSRFNGLSWISGSSLGRNDEVLVGIESSGAWFELSIQQGQIMSQNLGAYPFGSLSSGDAFSIEGIGTFASIKAFGSIFDRIVSINPQSPTLIDQTFVDLNGYLAIYGLAGWRGFLYAFDETGAILKINLQTKAIQRLNNDPKPWWGAGVSTILYSE
jgi:hypothetical protein